MTTAIWWIRRDLRLTDNQALGTALAKGDAVLPTFVLDPRLIGSRYVGSKRLAFLWEGLRRLDADLRERESRLIVREGDPGQELVSLADEADASLVVAERDFSPFARRRDERIAQRLTLELTPGLTVQPPGAILKEDGDPYIVYTPFSRKWKDRTSLPTNSIRPAPDRIPTPDGVGRSPIPAEPQLSADALFVPGEAEAQRRLESFLDGENAPIYDYADVRNRVDLKGTSQLSPYLRFGMLSARQAVVSALAAIDNAPDQAAHQGAETWLNELIWREFYVHILAHFPHVRGRSFRQELQEIVWENDDALFDAWREGRTGFPIVDAAMRQLSQTGWMHNRARMIVASFLVKDLLIDWRWGERWFMKHLVDGDPVANNGGWQWTAGTGTDAAPYFRIFNPILQGKKHDPHGEFIRHWVPELASVPEKYIHEPWRMPEKAQRASECVIGQDYPALLVDHFERRERALEMYKTASP